jgi:hypothetical protein
LTAARAVAGKQAAQHATRHALQPPQQPAAKRMLAKGSAQGTGSAGKLSPRSFNAPVAGPVSPLASPARPLGEPSTRAQTSPRKGGGGSSSQQQSAGAQQGHGQGAALASPGGVRGRVSSGVAGSFQ